MSRQTLRKRHNLTLVDLEHATTVCAVCGPVEIIVSDAPREYIKKCCSVISQIEETSKKHIRFLENIRLINEYIRSHVCKRCGYWSREPKGFRFFEMHLSKARRIASLVKTAKPERLKLELERRDMFCKKCYMLIRREVTQNIPAPPVKRFDVI